MKIFNGFVASTIILASLTGLSEVTIINQVHADSLDKITKNQDITKISEKKLLTIKLRKELNIPYEDGIEKQIQSKDSVLADIFAEYPQITLNRVFTSLSSTQIQSLSTNKKEDHSEIYSNMVNYYNVEVPNHVDTSVLLEKFKKSYIIEDVYANETESENIVPPELQSTRNVFNPLNNPHFEDQEYLKEAPQGINALYAWNVKGGDGTGATFIDLELGWQLNHEDLLKQNKSKVELMSGINVGGYAWHGTSVLGVVSAEDNNKGNIGITPNANVKVISIIRDNGQKNKADAILSAVENSKSGDVLLLELQEKVRDQDDIRFLPVEIQPEIFDAIRAGTDKGIIIIEAAGNGNNVNKGNETGNDLDQYIDRNGKQVLNRQSPDFKDSGAIFVGAASSTFPHTRLFYSNYGSRVDVYGWGENVGTLGSDPKLRGRKEANKNMDWGEFETNHYRSNFGGTSSASSIIAGAAVSLQGIAKAHGKTPYTPDELRKVLSNPETGTESKNPAQDKIGVLPDLKAIINNVNL
ncbi:S8 family peptidase [Bacillus sp. CDB3]|uniref:S8 family peptidase n=1 Tax=Bacillus sp. CDB3 TaxID=360310 RepID=UPI0009D8D0D9|nr:S8 family peptidase [Bacillus sp. CDB3]OQR53405.1 hypothetical protein CDB3_29910 [Bacillus sp. CDB3]